MAERAPGSGILGSVDQSRNVQIVRRLFRLRETGDIDETLDYFAEDAENRPITTDRVLRGREEIRAFLEDTAASGTVLEASTFRFEANDAGQVAVFGRLAGPRAGRDQGHARGLDLHARGREGGARGGLSRASPRPRRPSASLANGKSAT